MNVVVTGGGTIAPIDAVRRITNVSTGRFSAAIAECCLDRGARVWHVHAPGAQVPFSRSARLELDADPEAEIERLRGLADRYRAVRDRLHLLPLAIGTVGDYAATLRAVMTDRSVDLAFLAMAVSDFEPIPRPGKIESTDGPLRIDCATTPKVIRSVRDWAPGAFLVGFKLLVDADPARLVAAAVEANRLNRADLTVANDLRTVREGRHAVFLVRPGGESEALDPAEGDVADRLVDRAFAWAAEARAGHSALP